MRSLAMVLAMACALAGCPDSGDEGAAGSGGEDLPRWVVIACHSEHGIVPNTTRVDHGERCLPEPIPHGEDLLAHFQLSCATTPGLQCPYFCDYKRSGFDVIYCDNRD